MNPNWLAEGLCPTHGTPLERMSDHGWCEECGLGFSLAPDAITLHLRLRNARGERVKATLPQRWTADIEETE